MREHAPTVDLLVPTRDRHHCLRASLPAWRAAAARAGAGIILCDQSAQPFAAAGVRVLHRPDLGGLPAARNALLRASRAEVVVFLDDDCDLAEDFVTRVQGLAASEPRGLAWGPVVERRDRATRWAHRLVHHGVFSDPRRLLAGPSDRPARALFGCCFAVRRAAALATGFDARRPGYALGEDYDFFLRLGRAHPGPCARFARTLRAHHRQDGGDRAGRDARGRAKGAFLLWLARRHGGGNPLTLLHFGLALGAAASARGQEPGSWRGVLAGVLGAGRQRPVPPG